MDNPLYLALTDWVGSNAWVVQVFAVVLLVAIANLFTRLLLSRIHSKLRETENPWDDAVIGALRRPLGLLLWVVGIAFAAEIVRLETGTEATLFNAVTPLRDIGVIACLAWFLLRLSQQVQDNYVDRNTGDEAAVDVTTVDAIGKLVRVSILVTAALVMLQTLGFSISGVLAFGGVGGIAIGFAAKDLLANFFGGLMIYMERPFSVGDWVRSPDRDIEGTVEYIGWRLTRIRSFDKRPVYVPNSVFSTIVVVNPSRMSHRRIHETIGLRYEDAKQLRLILDDIRQMLGEHPEIDQSQTLMVNFNSYAASSLDFFIYAFTRTTVWTRYHEVKEDVLLKIGDIIAKHEAEIAFPTSTMHITQAAVDDSEAHAV